MKKYLLILLACLPQVSFATVISSNMVYTFYGRPSSLFIPLYFILIIPLIFQTIVFHFFMKSASMKSKVFLQISVILVGALNSLASLFFYNFSSISSDIFIKNKYYFFHTYILDIIATINYIYYGIIFLPVFSTVILIALLIKWALIADSTSKKEFVDPLITKLGTEN